MADVGTFLDITKKYFRKNKNTSQFKKKRNRLYQVTTLHKGDKQRINQQTF